MGWYQCLLFLKISKKGDPSLFCLSFLGGKVVKQKDHCLQNQADGDLTQLGQYYLSLSYICKM